MSLADRIAQRKAKKPQESSDTRRSSQPRKRSARRSSSSTKTELKELLLEHQTIEARLLTWCRNVASYKMFQGRQITRTLQQILAEQEDLAKKTRKALAR